MAENHFAGEGNGLHKSFPSLDPMIHIVNEDDQYFFLTNKKKNSVLSLFQKILRLKSLTSPNNSKIATK